MQTSHPAVWRRYNAFRAMLLFTLPTTIGFTLLHLGRQEPFLALVDLVLFCITLGVLVALRRGTPQHRLVLIYLLPLLPVFFAALQAPMSYPGMESWVATIPVFSYLLLPVRIALPLTVACLALAILAYLLGADDAPHRLEASRAARVIAPALAMLVMCHFYSREIVHSENGLLERLAIDSHTQLWNRTKLADEFQREQQRAERTEKPLSLILIDLDDFKKINDRYGHHAGDAVLVYFSELLKARVRETDLPCRVGGEEFAVLLPNTNAAGARDLAEDIRRTLEANEFLYGGESIRITMSAGVAELGRDGTNWSGLYRAADAYLYACKERGRNCVISGLANEATV